MATGTVRPHGNRFKDLTGQTFDRLTVLSFAEIRCGQTMWLCRCSCGKEIVAFGANLTRGKSRSCGCLRKEMVSARRTSHGESYTTGRTTEYQIWSGMIKRCENPANHAYGRYGGRGITICERWRSSYANFLADMGRRPSLQHSIDRIDNDGHYEPENCRWATWSEQRRNQRPRITSAA